MKSFRLFSWPELPAAYHHTSYRRMLSDMSHRYVTTAQLMSSSGAKRVQVRGFLDMLDRRGLLREREADADSFFDSLRPLGNWLRRTVTGSNAPRR